MSGCVFICYFIVAQFPHGHDGPFMLVFALNDFMLLILLEGNARGFFPFYRMLYA